MDELAYYTLLLSTAQGLTLLGTLRFQVVSTEPLDRSPAGTEQLLAQAQQQVLPDSAGQPPAILEQLRHQVPPQAQYIEITEAPLAGTLTVPLLTGLAPVRLTGVIYSAVGFPLSAVLFNTGTPSVVLQFGFFSRVALVGGLLWQPGPPGTALAVPFSLLARQVGTLA